MHVAARCPLPAFALIALAVCAHAQAPVIRPGECLYLTGAPPGGPAAATEQKVGGQYVVPIPDAVVHVDIDRDGPNMVHLWLDPYTGNPSQPFQESQAWAWSGHEFVVEAGSEPTMGWVSLEGALKGIVRTIGPAPTSLADTTIEVRVQLVEVDEANGREVTVSDESTVALLARNDVNEPTIDFGRRLEATFVPGKRYRARVVLGVATVFRYAEFDFGAPGTGRALSYDMIQVCLASPTSRVDEGASAHLEMLLHDKACIPSLWLPTAQGGRLETARELVADRLAKAVASGDPNVNARVAQARLVAADTDIAAGQFQRACRNLSDGLRALTTP